MAALRNLHNVITAQVQYLSRFGRYATSLHELGPTVAGLISSEMAREVKNGYRYVIQATPVVFNGGRRSFYADQTGVIRQSWGAEPATEGNEELK